MPSYNPGSYNPNSRFKPVPNGKYSFTVTEAETKVSQKGNQMISLRLAFAVGRENDLTVYDRLVFIDSATWVIHDFCAATGLDFSMGSLEPQDCIGRTGMAKLVLGKENANGKQYMEVDAYLAPEGYTEQPASDMPAAPPAMPPQTNLPQAPPQYVPPPAYDGPPAEPTPPTDQFNDMGGDDIPF